MNGLLEHPTTRPVLPPKVTVSLMLTGGDGIFYLKVAPEDADLGVYQNDSGNDCPASVLLHGDALGDAATTHIEDDQYPIYAALTVLDDHDRLPAEEREAHSSWETDEAHRVIILRCDSLWAYLREGVIDVNTPVTYKDIAPWLETLYDGDADNYMLAGAARHPSMKLVVVGCLDMRPRTHGSADIYWTPYMAYGEGDVYWTPYMAYEEGDLMVRDEQAGQPRADGLPDLVPIGL